MNKAYIKQSSWSQGMKYWNLNFSEEIVPVTNKAWMMAVRTLSTHG